MTIQDMMLSSTSDQDVCRKQSPLISVVVACFNEEAVVRETNRRLAAVLQGQDFTFEIIYVNDGSTDSTFDLLRQMQAEDERIVVIDLTRNFGHQVATTAGLDHASGDAVVLIDADLQDPPETILDMVARWRTGYDVVYGFRQERQGETVFKQWTAKVFCRVLNKLSSVPIPLDTGDFRLMDRAVVDSLHSMPERDRFLRGMVSWTGFRQIGVPYYRAARYAGESKYPLIKMIRFATDGILSFSVVPLELASMLGFIASIVALLGGVVAIGFRLFTDKWVPGWASIFFAVLFMGGAQLICLGIIGEYVGRIYGETKRRPLYFVQRRLGGREMGAEQDTARLISTYSQLNK